MADVVLKRHCKLLSFFTIILISNSSAVDKAARVNDVCVVRPSTAGFAPVHFYRAACNAETRSSNENSVCPSVAVASPEFCSRGGGGTEPRRTGSVPKFVVTKSSTTESHLALGSLQKKPNTDASTARDLKRAQGRALD